MILVLRGDLSKKDGEIKGNVISTFKPNLRGICN